eukprot:scaffold187307_cov26-Tisochrysis_lutea.AAC.2
MGVNNRGGVRTWCPHLDALTDNRSRGAQKPAQLAVTFQDRRVARARACRLTSRIEGLSCTPATIAARASSGPVQIFRAPTSEGGSAASDASSSVPVTPLPKPPRTRSSRRPTSRGRRSSAGWPSCQQAGNPARARRQSTWTREPVAVGREDHRVDDIARDKRVQVLALVEIPEHGGAVLTAGCAERAIGRDSDSVEVAGVADKVGAQLAIGEVPYLDELVPTA